MSASGSLCCCCCMRPKSSRDSVNILPEGDYLLPGGAWDPANSSPPSSRSRGGSKRSRVSTRSNYTSSIRSFLSRRFRRTRSSQNEVETDLPEEVGGSGEYLAPPMVPSKTLPMIEDFKPLRTVGRGAFGKVMLAVQNETRILYALKVVPKAKITTKKQVDQILGESQILKSIRHPFCVALQYAFQNDDFLFYVFEFAAGGMLFYHLRKEGKFSEPRARFYFGEIVLALDYLHSFGIVFRDLKPENCMLAEQGHILLTDFGSAKMLEVSQKTNTMAGTPQYIAPEVLRGEPYSFSADWWSCGILLYEMLTGKTPFSSGDRVELYKLVLRGYFSVPRGVSPRAKALMHRLINKDPTKRIGCDCGSCQYHSAANIKQHNFFSTTALDDDEVGRYSMEDAEREWERELEESHHRRSRNASFLNTAHTFFRTVSVSARKMSMSVSPTLGTPCEWSWEQLEAREVTPPYKPILSSPTDLRNFDPTLTCIPPTFSDLITTERSLHVENFDYVAPEGLITSRQNAVIKNTLAHTTSVEILGSPSERSDYSMVPTNSMAAEELAAPTSEHVPVGQRNSTDEEKVLIQSKAESASTTAAQFGRLERSNTPYATEVVVTADINT